LATRLILDQKSSGSKPDGTTDNQSLTIHFVGDFSLLPGSCQVFGEVKNISIQIMKSNFFIYNPSTVELSSGCKLETVKNQRLTGSLQQKTQ